MCCLCARWAEGTPVHRLSSILSPFAHQISLNCKVIGASSTLHGWNPHPSEPGRPPPSLPPSIFNTRDTSPLPQHGAHMPVILNLIKETLQTGNTMSCERRCNGSPVFEAHSSISVYFFFFLSNWAVSYFVFKNQLVLTESHRPPFLPHSVRLQKWKKQDKSNPLGVGCGGCMCRLVCRKR